uniref:Uncharacterized protein n=1 Tax=Eiseniibacteriota bacterium TaxID=2212470 RepID=A0A832I1Y2_UNCEI
MTFVRSASARGFAAAARVAKPAALAAAGLALAALAAAAPGDRPSEARGPIHKVNPVLLNAPGYRPPNDPESLSVVIGRRTNAPRVSIPFEAGGASSMEDLGRRVCRYLHRARRDSLRALCVTEGDFARILWREFPQSRPATGLRWEDAFALLHRRNEGGISRGLGEWGDRPLRFVRWERADTVAKYKNFKLHGGLTLVATDGDGREERLDFVRAVVERRGRFKLYSLKD